MQPKRRLDVTQCNFKLPPMPNSDVNRACAKLASFAICFEQLMAADMNRILNDHNFPRFLSAPTPQDFLIFFTAHAHERDRPNNFPEPHRQALRAELNQHSVLDAEFAKRVWERFENLTAPKTNVHLTRGPVEGILQMVKDDNNRSQNSGSLLSFARNQGDPIASWKAHLSQPHLKRLGRKVSAFWLRDLQYFFEVWDRGDRSPAFQPLDLWVLRWCKKFWPGHNEDATNSKWDIGLSPARYLEVANQLIRALPDSVNPIKFNMAAWFCGRFLNECLCASGVFFVGPAKFNDIPPDPLLSLVSQLNADRTNKAIRNANELDWRGD